jgi:LacI family transcriptional regulator
MTGSGEIQPNQRPAGIKDIALALGVSIGTVDRALHARPGINAMTRARVLKMAGTLGYQPNFAARHLKLNRKLSISVHLPREIASFFDAMREGIEEAAAPFQSSIAIRYRSYPHLGENDLELLPEALADKASGIILAPGHPAKLKPWIRKAARGNVPVVCVATDAPGTERLCTVSVDAAASGALVAELLTRFVRKPGPVLLVTGDLSTVDHAEKVRAFRECLGIIESPLRVAATLESHDDPEQAYRLTRQALAKYPKLSGIYVGTANSVPVVKALEDCGRLEGITVITTDLFPALVPLIRDGKVVATVYQRPKAQGRMAFKALYQFLVEGKCPPLRQRVPPHMILRSNLDLFLECYQAMPKGLLVRCEAR